MCGRAKSEERRAKSEERRAKSEERRASVYAMNGGLCVSVSQACAADQSACRRRVWCAKWCHYCGVHKRSPNDQNRTGDQLISEDTENGINHYSQTLYHLSYARIRHLPHTQTTTNT